ncbi:MAG: hypothetical protein FWC66_05090 [Oscillospiraceae bacterium]|nr:hypothetical protein [Oscillospiraceae bacterium]
MSYYPQDIYGRPMIPQPSYRGEVESLQQKMRDMEARLYGSGQPGAEQQSQAPPLITVNTEDDIKQHITNWVFIQSGQRLNFYVQASDKFLTAWHDATIPKTLTKYYQPEALPTEPVAIDFLAQAEASASGDKFCERFDCLEREMAEIKQLLKRLAKSDTKSKSPKRDADGKFVKKENGK